MSRLKNLRKKLLAGLCAFASGVGIAGAVNGVKYSAPKKIVAAALMADII